MVGAGGFVGRLAPHSSQGLGCPQRLLGCDLAQQPDVPLPGAGKLHHEAEPRGKPGFANNFSEPEGPKKTWAEFKTLFGRWHTKVAAICLKWLGVDVKQTSCTMNVLTLLSKLLPLYPTTYKVFEVLHKKCQALVKREKGPSGTSHTSLGLLADQYVRSSKSYGGCLI